MSLVFRKFPSIGSFVNVMYHVNKTKQYFDYSDVTYKAKVKLHGTNAAIVLHWDGENLTFGTQKRSKLTKIGDDNYGFSAWFESGASQYITDLLGDDLKGLEPFDYYIYGEWAGKGVQKNVAISETDGKNFFVFETYTTGPKFSKLDNISCQEISLYNIPVYKNYNVDLTSSESIKKFMKEVNDDVVEVEKCCPVAKDFFRIEGVGEGLVLSVENSYLEGAHEYSNTKGLTFKAKGEKHAVNKQNKPVEKDPIKATKVSEFVENTVTDNRLEQGIQETDSKLPKDISKVIKWVRNDIEKECLFMLGELSFDDVKKQMDKTIALKTKKKLENFGF